MESARFESSAVKCALSLVSPQPDVCGSVVTNIDYYGKMVKRIRILSSLWWEEDAPLMSLFGLCFLGKTKHHKYRRASYSHRISQVWRETKGCMRRRPLKHLLAKGGLSKVYRIYSKAQGSVVQDINAVRG